MSPQLFFFTGQTGAPQLVAINTTGAGMIQMFDLPALGVAVSDEFVLAAHNQSQTLYHYSRAMVHSIVLPYRGAPTVRKLASLPAAQGPRVFDTQASATAPALLELSYDSSGAATQTLVFDVRTGEVVDKLPALHHCNLTSTLYEVIRHAPLVDGAMSLPKPHPDGKDDDGGGWPASKIAIAVAIGLGVVALIVGGVCLYRRFGKRKQNSLDAVYESLNASFQP